MARPNKPCTVCGRLLFTSATSRPDPTCRPCRTAAASARPGKLCAVCSTEFRPGHPRVQTCSPSCGRRLAQESRGGPIRTGRTCEVCSSTYRANHAEQRTCSRACGEKVRAKRTKAPAALKTYACKGCGATRTQGDGSTWRSWCSYRCQLAEAGDRVMSFYALACELGPTGKGWRAKLVGYLRERDGGDCTICHEPIRFDLPSGPKGDDRGPSIDHMVPRSCGGTDDLSNLRLACWGCNRKRKTGRPGEALQLLLIG